MGEKIGIASVKYFDLRKNRTTDYIFDWDEMLSFEGNTAPYLLYAVTRLKKLVKSRQTNLEKPNLTDLEASRIDEPEERKLIFQIVRFPDALDDVQKTSRTTSFMSIPF